MTCAKRWSLSLLHAREAAGRADSEAFRVFRISMPAPALDDLRDARVGDPFQAALRRLEVPDRGRDDEFSSPGLLVTGLDRIEFVYVEAALQAREETIGRATALLS